MFVIGVYSWFQLQWLVVALLWSCQVQHAVSEATTDAFVDLSTERCLRRQMLGAHSDTDLASATGSVYACLHNSLTCRKQRPPVSATRPPANVLLLSRDIKNTICGDLSWAPVLGHTGLVVMHHWHIKVKETWFLQITINYFNIQYTDGCVGNRMVLEQKDNPNSVTVRGKYCGYRQPWVHTFDTDSASMRVLWAEIEEEFATPDTSFKFRGYFESLHEKPKELAAPKTKAVFEPESLLLPWKEQETGTVNGRQVYDFVVQTYIQNILHVVVSTSSESEWQAHDGPDATYPPLTAPLSTTGFLLFIKVYGYDTGLFFSVASEQHTASQCEQPQPNGQFAINAESARLLFCRQWFSTSVHPKINVNFFNVIAPEMDTCRLAGLALGMEINGSLVMLRPMCVSYRQETQPLFVSPNSKVFIMFYAYEAVKIDISLSVLNDNECPGIPVMCSQVPTVDFFPVPKELIIDDVVQLKMGRNMELALLSDRCVRLFRLPNMIQCSEVTIRHITGSSFHCKLNVEEPINKFEISSYMAIVNVQTKFQFKVLEVGRPDFMHWFDSALNSQLSQLNILNENKTTITSLFTQFASPSMWSLSVQPLKCIQQSLSARMVLSFFDQCGHLIAPITDASYQFSIRVPADHHIYFMVDRQFSLCSLFCSRVSYMKVSNGDLTFEFHGTSWETPWKTMTNEARFQLIVNHCDAAPHLRCTHDFHYTSHKNEAVDEAQPSGRSGRCRIADSDYKLTFADTWSKGKEMCEREEGWQMVSISSRREMDALLTNAVLHPQCSEALGELFTAELVFIGLSKVAPLWVWESGERMQISDWLSSRTYAANYPRVYVSDMVKIKSAYLRQKFQQGTAIKSNEDECVGMLLFNQHVTPLWVAFPCYLEFSAAVICEKRLVGSTERPPMSTPMPGVNTSTGRPHLVPKDYSFCGNKWSWASGKCWRMLLNTNNTISCSAVGGRQVVVRDADLPTISWMLSLWKMKLVVPSGGLIHIGKSPNSSHCIVRELRDDEFEDKTVSCESHERVKYVLCEGDAVNSSSIGCPNGTFTCDDSSCIMSHQRCDKASDCPRGEDELGCPAQPCSVGTVPCPNGGDCIKAHLVCDGKDVCREEKYCGTPLNLCDGKTQWRCGKICIDKRFRCDFQPDCLSEGDEKSCSNDEKCRSIASSRADSGLIYRMPSDLQCYSNKSLIKQCSDFGEEFSPCSSDIGSHQCFPRHRRCFQDLDMYGDVLFCKNRDHLEGCERFECPGAFKCPGSFCVPSVRVCNGAEDCPGGEDEQYCVYGELNCQGKIRCSDSSSCIELADWCNGVIDCSRGEDEKLCAACPSGCSCEIHSTICTSAVFTPESQHFQNKRSLTLRHMELTQDDTGGMLLRNPALVQLDLSENLFTSGLLDEAGSRSVIDLKLTYNQIRLIKSYDFLHIPGLIHLDLGGNPLQTISEFAFFGLSYMTHLNLSHLIIENIDDNGFSGLYYLYSLNLSFNQIRFLSSDSFNDLSRLQILDISNNPLLLMDKATFQPAEILQLLYTPAFKFCCAASHVGQCFPEPNEFSSCSDLMANTVLKVSIWILAFSTFIGNFGVIAWRRQQENPSILNFLVQHLGFADMTMGLYLLLIAIADFYYRGHYYLWDEQWRRSVFCKLAGFLSMLSSEMSVFVLLVIVTDRVNVIGLGRPGMGEKMAYAYVVFGWLICAVVSILPIVGLPYFGSGEYIKNGACFLFNITEGKVAGWEYATAIFIVFNLFVLVVLICGYTFTFISVSLRTGLESDVEAQVARKLAIVVFTDCCCWIPPITIGIMSLLNVSVNPQLAVWVAVFVFPLNSTLNPFLYTFSTMRCCEDDADADADEEDYACHVHHLDADGHSIAEDDFAAPSTSTAHLKEPNAPSTSTAHLKEPKATPRAKKSIRKSRHKRRNAPQQASNPESQEDQEKGQSHLLKVPNNKERSRSLPDIPEACSMSEEEETNFQISVLVAIKSKGHRRSTSSVGKLCKEESVSRPNDEGENEKRAFMTTATVNADMPGDGAAAVGIELDNIQHKE